MHSLHASSLQGYWAAPSKEALALVVVVSSIAFNMFLSGASSDHHTVLIITMQ
jgi:hypothetical protein